MVEQDGDEVAPLQQMAPFWDHCCPQNSPASRPRSDITSAQLSDGSSGRYFEERIHVPVQLDTSVHITRGTFYRTDHYITARTVVLSPASTFVRLRFSSAHKCEPSDGFRSTTAEADLDADEDTALLQKQDY
ncbi:hypothetical protein Bbelb_335810 [Branchiostoma belcheri]|nr:hypothetical protein Bbelb_335810 [Branchiostoma belcheri]